MTKISSLESNPAEERAVSANTEIFLKSIQVIMKSRGFVRTKASKASAMFDWVFEKGDRKITVSGWHGTGRPGTNRYWGSLKAILSIYDNKAYVDTAMARWKNDRVFDLDASNDTVVDHSKLLIDAIEYLHKA